MIGINKLIEISPKSANPSIMRVLHINHGGTKAVLIDVDYDKALPEWYNVDDLQQSLVTNEARILEIDHARPRLLQRPELPSKRQQRQVPIASSE